MYSGSQLCPTLTPKEKCVRLREYKQGQFNDLFHEHVTTQQLLEKDIKELLWVLVLRQEEATARQILQSYLTKRGRAAQP